MGKMSDKDFAEMGARLRARAARLIRQLDAERGYREQIEKDIARRVGTEPTAQAAPSVAAVAVPDAQTCRACGSRSDIDARFCKHCGTSLEAGR